MARFSPQRELILDILHATKAHPSAAIVYEEARKKMPNISLGTVYRNLNQLAASGQILRLTCDGKTDHFDACTDPHYHFICKCCGGVKALPLEPMTDILDKARACTSFQIDEATILFSGTCDNCQSEYIAG